MLRPDGALLVVTPAADHLAELVDALGLLRVDPDKADRVGASLAAHFTASAASRAAAARCGCRRRRSATLIGMDAQRLAHRPGRLNAAIDRRRTAMTRDRSAVTLT